ncbi:MAG: hypothetical protein RXR47_04620 [Nitrososphaeria archaeon]
MAQGIADRFHSARRRFLEGPARECDERGFVREDLTPGDGVFERPSTF